MIFFKSVDISTIDMSYRYIKQGYISDVNERKMMFFKQCKEELKLSRKYLTWVDKEFKLFSSHKTASPTKELEEGT